MDSKYRPPGRLVDLAFDWQSDRLPHEDIMVPLDELPDPEADSVDSHLTIKEQSLRWQEPYPEPPANNN